MWTGVKSAIGTLEKQHYGRGSRANPFHYIPLRPGKFTLRLFIVMPLNIDAGTGVVNLWIQSPCCGTQKTGTKIGAQSSVAGTSEDKTLFLFAIIISIFWMYIIENTYFIKYTLHFLPLSWLMQTSSWLCTGNSHLGHLGIGLMFFSWTMCISGRVSSFLSIALPNTSRFYSFSGLCWAQSVTSIGSQRRSSVAGDHLDVVLLLWEHFPFDYILWTLVQALIVYMEDIRFTNQHVSKNCLSTGAKDSCCPRIKETV